MKVFSRALLAVLSTACLATFAAAQTIPVGTFKHIIIVIQENRTPDNLFGYWPMRHVLAMGCLFPVPTSRTAAVA